MAEEFLTVLYIDDDPDDLMIFGDAISSLYPAVTVWTAQSGEEGLAILDEQEKKGQPFPQLIILDMNMPRMNGKQTLQAIRAREKGNDIPVVIFTTYSNITDVEFCKGFGADCITKPISYNNLNQTMKEVLSYSGIEL